MVCVRRVCCGSLRDVVVGREGEGRLLCVCVCVCVCVCIRVCVRAVRVCVS